MIKRRKQFAADSCILVGFPPILEIQIVGHPHLEKPPIGHEFLYGVTSSCDCFIMCIPIATRDPDDSVERLDHFGNAFVVLCTNPNIIRVVDNATLPRH
jgi:hypothetical protein